MSTALQRKAVEEIGARWLESASRETTAALDEYRFDPFAFLTQVNVWDPIRAQFVPFHAWEHQKEMIAGWIDLAGLLEQKAAFDNGDLDRIVLRFTNEIVEKSRQMGDTVVTAGACLWVVTFWDAPLLMQHSDLQEVDDGGQNSTWDSFFGKIRIMHSTITDPALKAPLSFRGGNNPLIRNRAHPQRFVTGEGQTADPGRGGRYSGAVIDEAARVRYDQQAQAALSRACPEGRLMLSTPKGRGNVYYRLVQNPPLGWKKVRHHWSKHPLYAEGMHVAGTDLDCPLCAANLLGAKWRADRPICHRYPGKLTSPWYDRAVAELTDEQVAEELDIDYTASLTARVYPEFNEDVHVVPMIAYDPKIPLEFSWDYGWDVTAVGIWQDAPNELRKIGEWEGGGMTPEDVVAEVKATLRALGVGEVELQPSMTSQWLMVGDPAGEGTQLSSGMPLTSDYASLGFTIANPGANRVTTTIKCLTRLLLGRPKPIRYSEATCPKTIEHMQSNRWPTDAQGNRRIGATKPLDDEHNHMCRADAYYATYKYPIADAEDQPLPPQVGGHPGSSDDRTLGIHGETADRIQADMKL